MLRHVDKFWGAFDIHTGGVDNICPHHENEIAQSGSRHRRTVRRYWLHAAHLIVDGEKMSKSRRNVYTLRDLQARASTPASPLSSPVGPLPQAAQLHLRPPWRRAGGAQQAGRPGVPPRTPAALSGKRPGLRAAVAEARAAILESLDADLNTAGALGHLFDAVREPTARSTRGRAGREEVEAMRGLLALFERVAGVRLGQQEILDEEVEDLIRRRTEARARKEYARRPNPRPARGARHRPRGTTPQGIRWKRPGRARPNWPRGA